MQQMKDALITSVIAYLCVDASPVGLGAVLSQKNPVETDIKQIIAYASRTLSDTETRYSQNEKEALAIIYGCENFTYTLGVGYLCS
jgi:hypothetical protein